MNSLLLPLILLALVGLGGSFIQRVSGFGLGIFAMLFLPYICPDTAFAAAVSCLWSCVTSLYNAVKYRKDANPRLIVPLICASMITIPVAVAFSARVPQRIMTVILGAVLIVLSVYFLAVSAKIRIKATPLSGAVAGAVGGALNGLFSTGGPPVVLYMAAATSDKAVYFASIQMYFAATNIYSTVMRAANGMITRELLLYAAAGAVGCMVGDRLGLLVWGKLDSEKVKKIIYIAMILSGILMII
ncbi:MAG: sulfite exporter TauE/SafE family protein [Clostridia bacterium]|nr:sulfite exporter TauE/SafE family protein [Clostridia bacterium]